jgi:hypothetical protein
MAGVTYLIPLPTSPLKGEEMIPPGLGLKKVFHAGCEGAVGLPRLARRKQNLSPFPPLQGEG